MYYSTQQTGLITKEIIEHDFRKIGLGIDPATEPFIIAASNEMKFRTSIGLDSTVNIIHYYLGDSTQAGFTENPNDIILFRTVDSGTPQTYLIGLINFVFTFYDAGGNVTSTLSAIRQMHFEYNLESTVSINDEYPAILIESRIDIKNIR